MQCLQRCLADINPLERTRSGPAISALAFAPGGGQAAGRYRQVLNLASLCRLHRRGFSADCEEHVR